MATLAPLSARALPLAGRARDIRGWEVRTLVDDVAVGTVEDLLLDDEGVVRWLDLALARGGHVLLPAGQARAESAGRLVRLPGLAANQLALLPRHDAAAGAPEAVGEAQLLAAYAAALLREARPATEPPPVAPVVPLGSLPDFKVATGEPDPRGWGVVGPGGERLGRVEELLVDPRLLRARYAVCVLRDDGRTVRVPLAHARVDRESELVCLDRLTMDSLPDLADWPGPDAPAVGTAPSAAISVRADARLDPRTLFEEPVA